MGYMDQINVDINGGTSAVSSETLYTTVVLKPNIVGDKSVLVQRMMITPNVKYVINSNFDMDGEQITVPTGCLIEFDGGSITNGTLIGQDTILIYHQPLETILPDVTLAGTFVDNAPLSADDESLVEDHDIIKVKNAGIQGKHLNANVVDDEDIHFTSANKLQLKDKAYDSVNYSGMGKVILRKNMVDGVNTLTQDMFYKGEVGSRVPNTNTIFVIKYDFVLGEDITVPADCILEFDGGSISGGTIIGYDIKVFGNVRIDKYAGTFYVGDSDKLLDETLKNTKYTIVETQEDFEAAVSSNATGKSYLLSGKTFYLNGQWSIPHNTNIYGIRGAAIEPLNTLNRYSIKDADAYYDNYYRCPLKKQINMLSVAVNTKNDSLVHLTQRTYSYTIGSKITYSNGVLGIKFIDANNYWDDTVIKPGYTFGIITHGWYKVPFIINSVTKWDLTCTPLTWNSNLAASYNIDRGIPQEVTLYNIDVPTKDSNTFYNTDGIRYDGSYIYIPNGVEEITIIDPKETDNDNTGYLLWPEGSVNIQDIVIKNAPLGLCNPRENNEQFTIKINNCKFINVTKAIQIRAFSGNYITEGFVENCTFLNCNLGGSYWVDSFANGRGTGLTLRIDTWTVAEAESITAVNQHVRNNKFINDDFLYYPTDRATTAINSYCEITGNEFVNFPYSIGWMQHGNISIKYNNIYYTKDFIKEEKQLPFDAGFIYASQLFNYVVADNKNYGCYVDIERNSLWGYYSLTHNTTVVNAGFLSAGLARQVRGIYIDEGRTNVRCTCNKILSAFSFAIDSRDVENAHEGYTASSHNVKLWGNITESPVKLQLGATASGASFNFNVSLNSCKDIIEAAVGATSSISSSGAKHTLAYKIVENDTICIDKAFYDLFIGVNNPTMKDMFVPVENMTNSLKSTEIDGTKYIQGFSCFVSDLGKYAYFNGTSFKEYDGAALGVKRSGTFSEKPTSDKVYVGFRYFCTDRYTQEGTSSNPGIEIIFVGSGSWVDALGRPIT